MVCQICGNANDESRFCTQCGAEFSNPFRSSPLEQRNSDSSKASLTGKTLDEKYHLESVLGLGGLGLVYCARRVVLGDKVAVKVLDPAQVNDPQAITQFRREAQAAARIQHPNVLAVYDFGVSREGLIYLVMELTEGSTLRKLIAADGPLSQEFAAEIIRQAGAALDEAHRQGVIHRDIRPENLLLQTTPAGFHVKVSDFGVAALREITTGKLTQANAMIRTPHYLSPEQCLGEGPDRRSDVYSLGIVLFEMLTGVPPFDSEAPTAVVVQQVNQLPPLPRSINPQISPEVEAVVLHALKKQQDERPQTAGELARELSQAIQVRHPVAVEQAEAPSVNGAEIVDGTPGLVEETPADERSSGKGRMLALGALLVLLAIGGAVSYWWYRRNAASKTTASSVDAALQNRELLAGASPTATALPATEAMTPKDEPWSLIADETKSVEEPANALGAAVNQQLALIKPGGQLALAYRGGEFFGDGNGNDLWVYAPHQQQVSYAIFVREDRAAQWQQIDVNRKGFPELAAGHDLGHHGLTRGRQVLIRNTGKNDLSIDAVRAVYKDITGSGPVATKPRPKPAPAKKQVTKKPSSKANKKSHEKANKKSSQKKR